MRSEKGTVVQVSSGKALVETDAVSDCISCEARHYCVSGKDGKKRRVWADNPIGAGTGDTVAMEVSEKGVVASSVLLYLLPVALLVAGIIAGFFLPLTGYDRELVSIMGGLAGLAASFLIIRIISPFLNRRKVFSPTLVEVIRKDGEHKI